MKIAIAICLLGLGLVSYQYYKLDKEFRHLETSIEDNARRSLSEADKNEELEERIGTIEHSLEDMNFVFGNHNNN